MNVVRRINNLTMLDVRTGIHIDILSRFCSLSISLSLISSTSLFSFHLYTTYKEVWCKLDWRCLSSHIWRQHDSGSGGWRGVIGVGSRSLTLSSYEAVAVVLRSVDYKFLWVCELARMAAGLCREW